MEIKSCSSIGLKNGVVVFVTKEQLKKKTFSFKNNKIKKLITDYHRKGHFSGDSEERVPYFSGKDVLLFVGLGNEKKINLSKLRTIVRDAVSDSVFSRIKEIKIAPHSELENSLTAYVEGIAIGTYSWKKYVSKDKKDKEKEVEPKDKVFRILTGKGKVVEEVFKICQGVNYTRNLVNENADIMNSDQIEKEVHDIVRGKRGIKVKILREKELKKEGLNLLLAVNQGSRFQPRLIIIDYRHGGNEKYTALIGKGITFDTGGLNLKPSGYIEMMRMDMAGTAAVLGTLKNAISLELKRNVLFVLGVAENAVGKKAYKPGDVIKSYSGKYVQVSDTDAEGRLVLADAIAYIAKNYKPARIIDIATLTGIMEIALGNEYFGLFSNKQALADKLLAAAKATDDRGWQMPVYEELKEHLKSKYADIKSLGLPKGIAGSLSAAQFLLEFAGKSDWAHLDIAGTAFAESERMYYEHGATGSGVRVFTHFLKNL